MGFRFNRRIRIRILPGVRINLGKSGVSTSIGGRGAWLTFGRRSTRATVGLPGTGLSCTQQLEHARVTETDGRRTAVRAWLWVLLAVVLIASALMTRSFAAANSASTRERVVLLEQEWNEASARVHCRDRGRDDAGCRREYLTNVDVYEHDITTQAQMSPACSGIVLKKVATTVARIEYANSHPGAQIWTLYINLTDAGPEESWLLVPWDEGRQSEGYNDPRGIALAVCAIVKGVGAKVD
jgi:hypothetical protein